MCGGSALPQPWFVWEPVRPNVPVTTSEKGETVEQALFCFVARSVNNYLTTRINKYYYEHSGCEYDSMNRI